MRSSDPVLHKQCTDCGMSGWAKQMQSAQTRCPVCQEAKARQAAARRQRECRERKQQALVQAQRTSPMPFSLEQKGDVLLLSQWQEPLIKFASDVMQAPLTDGLVRINGNFREVYVPSSVFESSSGVAVSGSTERSSAFWDRLFQPSGRRLRNGIPFDEIIKDTVCNAFAPLVQQYLGIASFYIHTVGIIIGAAGKGGIRAGVGQMPHIDVLDPELQLLRYLVPGKATLALNTTTAACCQDRSEMVTRVGYSASHIAREGSREDVQYYSASLLMRDVQSIRQQMQPVASIVQAGDTCVLAGSLPHAAPGLTNESPIRLAVFAVATPQRLRWPFDGSKQIQVGEAELYWASRAATEQQRVVLLQSAKQSLESWAGEIKERKLSVKHSAIGNALTAVLANVSRGELSDVQRDTCVSLFEDVLAFARSKASLWGWGNAEAREAS